MRMGDFLVNPYRLNVNIMATVKVKLRPSSIEGKAGVIYYKQTGETKVVNERMTLVFYRK